MDLEKKRWKRKNKVQISRQRQGHCLGAGEKDWLQQCGKNTMGIVRVFERPYDYYN